MRDKLWPAFISETNDSLDNLSLWLNQQDQTTHIDQLFRAFHTLKGSCSMLGLSHMETLAHHCEDILSSIRSKQIKFTSDIRTLLIEATQSLRKQFIFTSKNHENPPEDNVLLDKLILFNKTEEEHKDFLPEANIQEIINPIRTALTAVALALDGKANTKPLINLLSSLQNKTKTLPYKAFTSSLDTLLHAFNQQQNQDILPLSAQFFTQISRLESEIEEDFGLDAASKMCQNKLTPDYKNTIKSLSHTIASIKDTPSSLDITAITSLASQLNIFSILFKFVQAQALWRYIEQFFNDINRGHLKLNKDVLHLLLNIVDQTINHSSLAQEAEHKKALTELQNSIGLANHFHRDVESKRISLLTKTNLVSEALAELNSAQLDKLAIGLKEGNTVGEIDIDFADEITSEALINSLQDNANIIHSRTIFHDIINGVASRTSFSFLILTPLSFKALIDVLTKIDNNATSFSFIQKDNVTTEQSESDNQLIEETQMALSSIKIEGKTVNQMIADITQLVTLQNTQRQIIKDPSLQAKVSALIQSQPDENVQALLQHLLIIQQQANAHFDKIKLATASLQTKLLNLRVVPISIVFDRLHTLVNLTAAKLGKQVQLVVSGRDVKIDKSMVDMLAEPLAHMIRNSIDHGIEAPAIRQQLKKSATSQLKLNAKIDQGEIIIQLIDDGQGLNTEKIKHKSIQQGLIDKTETNIDKINQCIFHPGFSTAGNVSETSGRGVGMDVVKNRIHQVGGQIKLFSQVNLGTAVHLHLPLSAVVQKVILIQVNQQTFAIDERYVEKMISIEQDQIQMINHQPHLLYQDKVLAIENLAELLGEEKQNTFSTKQGIIIRLGNQLFVLAIDQLLTQKEIFVKESHPMIDNLPGVAGTTLLENGQVVVILDLLYIQQNRQTEQTIQSILPGAKETISS